MAFFGGIDGGASKTHCVIGDSEGKIVAEYFSAGSNHQVIGPDSAKKAIREALDGALSNAGISITDLDYTALGLAGADLEPDFIILNAICGEIFGNDRFKVMNDTWIGLRAGIPENWGIVTVCGTGSACSGRNREGVEATLRNLTFETGNSGGGFDIIREAFHFAFRSEEGTGCKTKLEEELPRLLGLNSMPDLLEAAVSMRIDPEKAYAVPVLVCELASDGDLVCQNILLEMGRTLGEIASGVIRKLHMEKLKFRVTLIGGVFKSSNPLLVDEYTTTVHRTAPNAKIGISKVKPAIGAYYLALGKYDKIMKTGLLNNIE